MPTSHFGLVSSQLRFVILLDISNLIMFTRMSNQRGWTLWKMRLTGKCHFLLYKDYMSFVHSFCCCCCCCCLLFILFSYKCWSNCLSDLHSCATQFIIYLSVWLSIYLHVSICLPSCLFIPLSSVTHFVCEELSVHDTIAFWLILARGVRCL